jgi:chemotaxis protein MotB
LAKKKKHEEEEGGSERWLLTYADLITLLLGLFVILYAMSIEDKAKYDGFKEALAQMFGGRSVLTGEKSVMKMPSTSRSSQAPGKTRKRTHSKLMSDLNSLLAKEINTQKVALKETPEGVSINLLELLLFDTGKADIKPQAYETLNKIATYIIEMPNQIRVEGHTDNVPISTPQFPSNWHLSIARAMNTGYYILQQGLVPQRLSIAGYGEYKPVAENDTPEHRTENRRVEIVILSGETELTPLSITDSTLAK